MSNDLINIMKNYILSQFRKEVTMSRKAILFTCIGLWLFVGRLSAQQDSSVVGGFLSQVTTLKFKVDTTDPPNDQFTANIRHLRSERGWFNVVNMIKLSIEAQRTTDTTHSKEYYDKLLADCEYGATHGLIENMLINLYRQCFTEKEVKELVEFYKTSAGKKLSSDFVVLSITGANAANEIVRAAAEKLSVEMNRDGRTK